MRYSRLLTPPACVLVAAFCAGAVLVMCSERLDWKSWSPRMSG